MRDEDKWVWEPVSIIPAAPGWRAVYDTDTEPFWISEPLPMWGLYREYNFYDRREKGDSEIFGVVPDGSGFERASDAVNFWCYLGPGEPDPTPDKARARCEHRRVINGEPVAATVTMADWQEIGGLWRLMAMSPVIEGIPVAVGVTGRPDSPEHAGQMFRTLHLLGVPVPPPYGGEQGFWELGWNEHTVAEHMIGAKVMVARSGKGHWFIVGAAV